jgi:signal transduction histidine kinase
MYNNFMQISPAANELSTETIFKICEISSKEKNWKELLDELFVLSRKYFIVDNLAIYLTDPDTERIDAVYARSFGRGKSAEADVSWGETIANQVVQKQIVFYEKPQQSNKENRFAEPFTLAIPIFPYQKIKGAVVFIRFGGPDFLKEAVTYASFLSKQVNAILQKKVLDEFAQKLAARSSEKQLQESFINTISHELRNPLGFIKGYTTTLLREDTQWDSTTQNDFLRIIDRETNNLQELIDNLLDSSRLQSGQMKFDTQMIRMDALIRDEISRAQVNYPGLVVHLVSEEPFTPINGDPRRLAQVFDNLLNNSIKYAPGSEIFINIRKSADFLAIEFRDKGPGISEKYLPQIFTRFFRDPEQSSHIHGSGLGLSICKEIVEHHAGTITASCPEGWGMVFTILLPIEKTASSNLVGGDLNGHKNFSS